MSILYVVLTLLLVIAAPSDADAQCAWVLWDRGWVEGFTIPDPKPITGWPERDRCEAERLARYARWGVSQPPFPGVAVEATSTTRTGAGGRSYFQFDCLPDTVDPRAPKGGGR